MESALTRTGSQATVAGLLRSMRRRANLSLSELARRAQVSKATVSRWESGHAEPDLAPLDSVLAAMRAEPADRNAVLSCISAPRAMLELRRESQSNPAQQDSDFRAPEFGDMLRSLRLRAGMRSRDAAGSLGVSPSALSLWECSERLPDLDLLSRAADLYGASEAERAALLCRKITSPLGFNPSLNQLAERRTQVLVDLSRGRFDNAELTLIGIQAHASRRLGIEPDANKVLASSLATQASLVAEQGRLAEAEKLAWQAMDIDLEWAHPHALQLPLYSVISWARFCHGPGGNSRGALQICLESAEGAFGPQLIENLCQQMRHWGELGNRRELDLAYERAMREHDIEPRCHRETTTSFYVAGLLAIGDYDAAGKNLPNTEFQFMAMPMHHGLVVAEYLIRIGDREAAEPHLRAVRDYALPRRLRNYDYDRVFALAYPDRP